MGDKHDDMVADDMENRQSYDAPVALDSDIRQRLELLISRFSAITGAMMSSRLIIALIIMLLAQGVQAHNFVTGKTVTPVYIQEGGELLLNSDDEIHYQKWNSTQLAGKVRIIQYIAGRKSAKKKNSIVN